MGQSNFQKRGIPIQSCQHWLRGEREILRWSVATKPEGATEEGEGVGGGHGGDILRFKV